MEKVRGLNDVVSGSKVKVIKPDGTITEEEATYWEDIDKRKRQRVEVKNANDIPML